MHTASSPAPDGPRAPGAVAERVPAGVDPPPPGAVGVFGDRLDLARRYAELLGSAGVERGLLGPNEVPRLWARHLLNCAVLTDLIPEGARVVDVGSGAGLPGVVLAVRRPDLHVDVVEPLQRRTVFLAEAVEALGLGDRVRVVRGRAEDARVRAQVDDADVVTARAVASLDRLAAWCLPLVSDNGRLLLLKGSDAEAEVGRTRAVMRRLGASSVRVVSCGADVVDPPATVVEVIPYRPDPRPRPRRSR